MVSPSCDTVEQWMAKPNHVVIAIL